MIDIGPPIGLMAIGLILWLAVDATLGAISIQTIGLILFIVGIVWLVIDLALVRPRRHGYVEQRPLARERVVERDVV